MWNNPVSRQRPSKRLQNGLKTAALLLGGLLLSACDTVGYHLEQAQLQAQRSSANAAAGEQRTGRSANSSSERVRVTGYAPISLQPGRTQEQKVLMAMRASKLRAYQELAAVVHGQYLFGTSQVRDLMLEDDRFSAAVAGVVRGARVVRTYPIQEDTYATILELDMADVQRAYIVQP